MSTVDVREAPDVSETAVGWPADRPRNQIKLDRILVVMDEDLLDPASGEQVPLLNRATVLAKQFGAELVLFHASYDESLDQKLFAVDAEVRLRRFELVDRAATQLAELAFRLETEHGVTVEHDAQWDHPEADAILRKAHEVQPDLVMKRSSQSDYVLGLFTNTDWELIRRSPANLWFVTGDAATIERIVTAVGTGGSDEDVIAAVDYDVCELASLVANGLGATHTVLHTYQLPLGLAGYAAYAPDLGVAPRTHPVTEQTGSMAMAHGAAIAAFAEYFHVEPGRIRVEQGRLRDVLPAAADELGAELIVMGARDLGRVERLLRPVDAEPVLARAPCDVLYVRETSELEAPQGTERPTPGIATVDLDEAVVAPEVAFGSPQQVVEHDVLSVAMRRWILQAWAQDVEARMDEENEGGPVEASEAALLAEIRRAEAALRNVKEEENAAVG